MPPLLLSKGEVAHALSVCVKTVDSLIGSGELKSLRIGRRRLVSAETLKAFIAAKENADT